MKSKCFYILYFSSILLFVKLISGCGDMVTSNSNLVFPDSLVSYISNVEPFMKVKCSYVGCHSQPPNNGFNAKSMTTWFELMSPDNLGLIIAYKPDNSVLIQMIEEKLPHKYYYFPSGYFTQNQINGMRKWIEEGAKNN